MEERSIQQEKKKKKRLISDIAVHFRHINWLQMEESIVLMTTLCPRVTSRQGRPPGQGPSNLVKTLAVFKIMPLMFVCMFEVTRDVSSAAENPAKPYLICSVRLKG